MNTRIKQLRDLVVALDAYDRKLDTIDPVAYKTAASSALTLTYSEMGLLPMSDFAGPPNALQTMAENIHFAVNGRFANVDGTGRADNASAVTSALFERLGKDADAAAQEVACSLMARLCAGSRGTARFARP